MTAYELNLDGLVGPTHNYAGLSYGNVASQAHGSAISNPKAAAKQGLLKMKALADAGFKQGILLPHQRPAIAPLKALGYRGTAAEILRQVQQQNPALLSSVSSASSMWVANAATVTPSADSIDGRVHFTAANLQAKLHRSIEHEFTSRQLSAIFHRAEYFTHHPALPSIDQFADEGAANHNRLCAHHGASGVELFVYGRQAFNPHNNGPKIFPARQTLEASEAIARLHQLPNENCVFAQQNPKVIDAGVFHNDVIAVANGPVLFYHQEAFLNSDALLKEIDQKLQGASLLAIEVASTQVSLSDAVSSYLFNSQLLTNSDASMTLVVPNNCQENSKVAHYLTELIADTGNPIAHIRSFDLKQSMQNGGGPACLRLRIALTDAELAAVHSGILMTNTLFEQLNQWVDKHYRDRLCQQDLADPALLIEVHTALDELTQITKLGALYPFQQ